MSRYALIDNGTRKVINVMEWGGDTNAWTPPAGCIAVQSDTANVGDTWTGSVFTPAPPVVDALAADRQRLRDYMPASGSAVAGLVSTFITDTTKDPAERATMAAMRSLIRVLTSLS